MCLERFVKVHSDSAPEHRARKTDAVHRHQTLFHWNSSLQTAKTSTQLTIRYKQVMHQTDIHSMDELKQRPIHYWCNTDQDVTDAASNQWCKRL